MKEKNIPFKNYIFLAVILILSVVFIIYFYMWYGTYEEGMLEAPIMDKYLTVINYNEIDNYLIENKDAVIYMSVLNNQDIRKFEKKFKNIINSNSLNNDILYLNLTSEFKNKKNYTAIKEDYSIQDLPSIVIFRNGDVYDVYNIKKNEYNIDMLIQYLMNVGVIDD